MIFRYIIGLFLFYMLVFSSCTHEPEVLELSEGWAKTSVNTAIFRKNSVVSDEEYQYMAWYDSSGHVVVAKHFLISMSVSGNQRMIPSSGKGMKNFIFLYRKLVREKVMKIRKICPQKW
ncbi:MAG: hypothetical protein PWR04_639 [Anaerophaga sp.]|nr:hypothetical protein [Anaerophaga sp.]